ncbi:hypothetical protein AB0I28_35240 [Phytomonospora sp. NPDC050363]|uniref:hypothetical protein n=1 Tax=Phytomonospora sp. NPDC050363 TaxID=3155642 RepID=UPI0033E9980C
MSPKPFTRALACVAVSSTAAFALSGCGAEESGAGDAFGRVAEDSGHIAWVMLLATLGGFGLAALVIWLVIRRKRAAEVRARQVKKPADVPVFRAAVVATGNVPTVPPGERTSLPRRKPAQDRGGEGAAPAVPPGVASVPEPARMRSEIRPQPPAKAVSPPKPRIVEGLVPEPTRLEPAVRREFLADPTEPTEKQAAVREVPVAEEADPGETRVLRAVRPEDLDGASAEPEVKSAPVLEPTKIQPAVRLEDLESPASAPVSDERPPAVENKAEAAAEPQRPTEGTEQEEPEAASVVVAAGDEVVELPVVEPSGAREDGPGDQAEPAGPAEPTVVFRAVTLPEDDEPAKSGAHEDVPAEPEAPEPEPTPQPETPSSEVEEASPPAAAQDDPADPADSARDDAVATSDTVERDKAEPRPSTAEPEAAEAAEAAPKPESRPKTTGRAKAPAPPEPPVVPGQRPVFPEWPTEPFMIPPKQPPAE